MQQQEEDAAGEVVRDHERHKGPQNVDVVGLGELDPPRERIAVVEPLDHRRRN